MATITEIGKFIRRYTMQDLLELDLSHTEELIKQLKKNLQQQPTAN